MAITVAARRASFIIYKDEPESPSTSPKAKTSVSATRSARVALSAAGNKENLNPLTGRRPTTEDYSGKKRKTNVLTTKLLVATGKALAVPTSPKKRKLTSPTEGPADKKEKKEKRTVSSGKSQRISRVRKATDLPRLDEVVEEEVEGRFVEHPLDKITQAAVDTRCYELTVLPLADLSKAYEQVISPESFSDRESSPESKV